MKTNKVNKIGIIQNEDCEEPKYKPHSKTGTQIDKAGLLSSIPPMVFIIHDIHAFYPYKIGQVGDYELQQTYNQICIDGKLKEEHKHLETKGLNHVLQFTKVLKKEWTKIMLSHVHNMTMWQDELVKINRDVIHMMTKYPIIENPKQLGFH